MTSGVVSCSKNCFTTPASIGKGGRSSGVEVGDQLALEASDLILEDELALLEALELELVGLEVERQACDDFIQIAVRYAQFPQLFHILEKLAIDVVLIFDFAHRLAVGRSTRVTGSRPA